MNNINQLLEKYWNAETSLQEEAELRMYFDGSDVSDEHLAFVGLFNHIAQYRSIHIDLDIDSLFNSLQNMDQLLDKYWNAETTLDEEKVIKAYFRSDEIADEHKEHVALFDYYEAQRNQSIELDLASLFQEAPSIDQLLEKYWNAEASLEEEQSLKNYFNNNEVADEHKEFLPLFQHYETAGNETSNLDLEALFTESNDKGNRASDTEPAPQPKEAKIFNLRKLATAVAAIFILGFAAMSVMDQSSTIETQYKGKYVQLNQEADAQEAYEITREALAFLSKNMKKGSNTVVRSVAKAEKVNIFK